MMEKRSPWHAFDKTASDDRILVPLCPTDKFDAAPPAAPLSIEELEVGLDLLDSGAVDPMLFWEENQAAYRASILVAIRESCEALSSMDLPPHCRAELERDVEQLRQYLEIADGDDRADSVRTRSTRVQ